MPRYASLRLPIDMLFGHGRTIAEGNLAMTHNTGYTAQRLARVAMAAGFAEVRVMEGPHYDLWAILLAPAGRLADLAPMFRGTNVSGLFDEASPPPPVVPAPRAAPVESQNFRVV